MGPSAAKRTQVWTGKSKENEWLGPLGEGLSWGVMFNTYGSVGMGSMAPLQAHKVEI